MNRESERWEEEREEERVEVRVTTRIPTRINNCYREYIHRFNNEHKLKYECHNYIDAINGAATRKRRCTGSSWNTDVDCCTAGPPLLPLLPTPALAVMTTASSRHRSSTHGRLGTRWMTGGTHAFTPSTALFVLIMSWICLVPMFGSKMKHFSWIQQEAFVFQVLDWWTILHSWSRGLIECLTVCITGSHYYPSGPGTSLAALGWCMGSPWCNTTATATTASSHPRRCRHHSSRRCHTEVY